MAVENRQPDHDIRGSWAAPDGYYSNTRKGYWAIAGSGILTNTITNKRLALMRL